MVVIYHGFFFGNYLVQNGGKVCRCFYRQIIFSLVNSRANDLFYFTDGKSIGNTNG